MDTTKTFYNSNLKALIRAVNALLNRSVIVLDSKCPAFTETEDNQTMSHILLDLK